VSSNLQVSVRILGGLMALGYEIGTIMKRNSIIHSDDRLTIKLDTIEGMGTGFVQVHIFLFSTAHALHYVQMCYMIAWHGQQEINLFLTALALHYLVCNTVCDCPTWSAGDACLYRLFSCLPVLSGKLL